MDSAISFSVDVLTAKVINVATKPDPTDSPQVTQIKTILRPDTLVQRETKARRALYLAKEELESAKEQITRLPITATESEQGNMEIAGISPEHISTIFLDPLARLTLSGTFIRAYTNAMKCFMAKDCAPISNRIKALHTAINSSCLRTLVGSLTLDLDRNRLATWIKEIFNDKEMKVCVKNAMKLNEFWQTASTTSPGHYLATTTCSTNAEAGTAVILIIRELCSLSTWTMSGADTTQELLEGYFSTQSRYQLLSKIINENSLPRKTEFALKAHSFVLKNLYKKRLKSHNPLYSFLSFDFNMTDCCVPLSLRQRTSGKLVDNLDTFIDEAFSCSNNINLAIVIGDPFSGKTTFLQKIAFDWANGSHFSKYELVFFAELRYAPDGTYDSIFQLTLAGIREQLDLLKFNIDYKRVLILLDGYDEKRNGQVCSELDTLLNNDKAVSHGFVDLLITSRPSTIIKRQSGASFWTIEGFVSENQRIDYIKRHFRNLPDPDLNAKCEAVNLQLKKHRCLLEIAKTPMMLTFFCLVHENMKQQITKPALFDAVIKLIIQRFDKKHPKENLLSQLAGVASSLPPDHYAHQAEEEVENWRNFLQLQRLGKLAFEALKQRKFVFGIKDFVIGPSVVDRRVLEKIGLLVKSSQYVGVGLDVKYQFAHRAIQDFFGALHLLYWQGDSNQLEPQPISIAEELLKKNVFKDDLYDFVRMTLDVLMAERKQTALHSFSPILEVLTGFQCNTYGASICLQSDSIEEMKTEHKFFEDIMEKCKMIRNIYIDGKGAVLDFAWEIKLPDDNAVERIRVQLNQLSFIRNSDPMVSVHSSRLVELELIFDECLFKPERLLRTVAIHQRTLKVLRINLKPVMLEKFLILPACKSVPSKWPGSLYLTFIDPTEMHVIPLTGVSNYPSRNSALNRESNENRSISRILTMFLHVTELSIDSPLRNANITSLVWMANPPSFSPSFFPNLSKIKHRFYVDTLRKTDLKNLLQKIFRSAPKIKEVTMNISSSHSLDKNLDQIRTIENFYQDAIETTSIGSSIHVLRTTWHCAANAKEHCKSASRQPPQKVASFPPRSAASLKPNHKF